jgi:uncharacterized protein (DUF2141 family)
MRNWLKVASPTLAALSLGVGIGTAVADDAKADLTLQLSGFTHNGAHAIVKLYRNGQDVLGEPYVLKRLTIKDKAASVTFKQLEPGAYAVVVFHDENENGKIDHNFIGFPTEPLGFSNGFEPSLTNGMPTFEKLRFALKAPSKVLKITVK